MSLDPCHCRKGVVVVVVVVVVHCRFTRLNLSCATSYCHALVGNARVEGSKYPVDMSGP